MADSSEKPDTELNSDSDESISADEKPLFEVLNRYLEHLHQGDFSSRSQLLIQHPELKDLLSCLENLDSLAIPRTSATSVPPSENESFLVEESIMESDELQNQTSQTQQTRWNLVTGDLFGTYELIEELGRGGMGIVFKARQLNLNRHVALKMILASHLASEEEVRRFTDEAKAAGSLRHPNVVGIHESGQISGQHYFTMDYVEGTSLSQLIQKGLPGFDEIATLLEKVARAVDYLHQNQIVHRDLKPANILIDSAGEPYVTDFGLAKMFHEDHERTSTGTIIGTPCYMSPEQAAGKVSEVGPPSDIYSLGAILYELLTARPPFKEENPLDTLVQVLEQDPPLPREFQKTIPVELEMICLKCLEKNPQLRYATGAELAEDLERYLKQEPVHARSIGIQQEVKRWARRRPVLAARFAGLLVAMLITQITYSLWGSDLDYHLKVMGIFGFWTASTCLLQVLQQSDVGTRFVPYLWGAMDAAFLTYVLWFLDPPIGPLLIGYPLLVTACGLFFKVRMVIYMTIVSVISFAILCWLRPDQFGPTQYPILFASVLTVLGLIVAYQVHRIRVLSHYLDHQKRN